jgi:hypothetical protein
MKTKYETQLEHFAYTFFRFEELDMASYEAERDSLYAYFEDHCAYFTEADELLYKEADELCDIAGEEIEAEDRRDQLEQELDERRYAGSAHLS